MARQESPLSPDKSTLLLALRRRFDLALVSRARL
jgi:hypothetical protein